LAIGNKNKAYADSSGMFRDCKWPLFNMHYLYNDMRV
jgi:hypothetical protein